jgi:phosphoribosylamine--glycine ligase
MNVLVVGSGGREHALTWAIGRSPELDHLYVAPGNAGTGTIAQNIAIDPGDIDSLVHFAREQNIDLTVVGPEAPLVAGIVDRFEEAGLRCFGAKAAAARLEGSKVFAKEFMKRYEVPTGAFAVFDNPESARDHVSGGGLPVVIKADGLAAGKGVIVAETIEEAHAAIDEIMIGRKFGDSGNRVLVEEFLSGEEVSVHSICGGGKAVLFPPSQDHKRIFDADRGPNTGGMGAYAPVPFLTDDMHEEIYHNVVLRTLRGMEEEGTPYTGVLYAGMILTDKGPRVLEFNVRFGDPETQVILPLLKSDLLRLLFDSAGDTLPDQVELHEHRYAATVVVASKGYPGAYKKGQPIDGLEQVERSNRVVFHAGTAGGSGEFVTSGGRVVAVSAWDDNLADAIEGAYVGVRKIKFPGAYWRTDIGKKAL